ncbi:hypothetical protein pb186bvf_013473 [Paramecium bursaria]
MQQEIVFESIEDLPDFLKCSICREICIQPSKTYQDRYIRTCQIHVWNGRQVRSEVDRSEYNMLKCKCKYCGTIKNAFKIQKHQSKCQDIFTRKIKLSSQFKVVQNESLLECYDCIDIPFMPLYCESCQQLICFICRINHKCFKKFIQVDQNIIKSFHLDCSTRNCGQRVDLDTALNHYKMCELKFRLCPGFENCNWMGSNKDYNYHKKYCQHTIFRVQNEQIEAENQIHEIQCNNLEMKFLWNRYLKKYQQEANYLNLLEKDYK